MTVNTDSTVTTLDDGAATTSGKTRKAAAAPTASSADIVSTKTNLEGQLSGKKVTLTIHRSNDDGGGDAVFLGLNGYAYQIPRDTPSVVPEEVASIVASAKETSYRHGPSGDIVEHTTPRFAFSISPA